MDVNGLCVPRQVAAGCLASDELTCAFEGVRITLIPDNVAPVGLHAAIRHVQPPLIRKLFAYTRSEWSPLATTFVEALQRLRWPTKPDRATVLRSGAPIGVRSYPNTAHDPSARLVDGLEEP